jgi:hypothetical protein
MESSDRGQGRLPPEVTSMMRRTLLYALLSAALLPPAVRAELIRVPQHHPTIQGALTAAAPGDRVVVGTGVYHEIISLRDSVAVESEVQGGAVLVGEAHLHFVNQVVISGFTVVSDYGGIHCFGGVGNRISGNIVTGGSDPVGPGITCYDTSPEIVGNIILRRKGIGIYLVGSSPHIVGNSIVENGHGEVLRAGIYCGAGSSPLIERNIIAWAGGPALFCEPNAMPVVTCNDFFANNGGEVVCGTDGGANISVDPRFCDVGEGDLSLRADSPCAGGEGCGQIGARGVSCAAPSAVDETTWGRLKARMRGGR